MPNATTLEIQQAVSGILRRLPNATELSVFALLSRDQVIDVLRNSSENNDYVKPVIRFYENVLGRRPDATGLTHWANILRTAAVGGAVGVSTYLRDDFWAATERLAVYPETDTHIQFVQKVYLRVFGRTADYPGLTYWVNQLNSGAFTRRQVLVETSESDESKVRFADIIGGWQSVAALGDTSIYEGSFFDPPY